MLDIVIEFSLKISTRKQAIKFLKKDQKKHKKICQLLMSKFRIRSSEISEEERTRKQEEERKGEEERRKEIERRRKEEEDRKKKEEEGRRKADDLKTLIINLQKAG